jgi:hypothetical protein
LATLRGFLKGAHTVAFSADGKRLAIGGGDHEAVKLRDTKSMQEAGKIEANGMRVCDTRPSVGSTKVAGAYWFYS